MAEENNQEEEKKSPIKLILMIVGGIVLLGVGIGVGILMSGGEDTGDFVVQSLSSNERKVLGTTEQDDVMARFQTLSQSLRERSTLPVSTKDAKRIF